MAKNARQYTSTEVDGLRGKGGLITPSRIGVPEVGRPRAPVSRSAAPAPLTYAQQREEYLQKTSAMTAAEKKEHNRLKRKRDDFDAHTQLEKNLAQQQMREKRKQVLADINKKFTAYTASKYEPTNQ
jgi:hypothetical protein